MSQTRMATLADIFSELSHFFTFWLKKRLGIGFWNPIYHINSIKSPGTLHFTKVGCYIELNK